MFYLKTRLKYRTIVLSFFSLCIYGAASQNLTVPSPPADAICVLFGENVTS